MEEANQPSNPIDMGNEDVKRRKKKKYNGIVKQTSTNFVPLNATVTHREAVQLYTSSLRDISAQ